MKKKAVFLLAIALLALSGCSKGKSSGCGGACVIGDKHEIVTRSEARGDPNRYGCPRWR